MAENEIRIDALPPAMMAERAENVGVTKSNLDFWSTLALGILAGAFVACGAIFYTTAIAGGAGMPFGLRRVFGGLTFCLGLIAVIIAGAELFTGNNLIVMAFISGKVTLRRLLRNWAIVYLGNFIGAVATASLLFVSGQYTFGGGEVGATALSIASGKCSLGFWQALTLGIMCNALVCLAVWFNFSTRTTTDKILATLFPITAFVAAGFEHSIANMYFLPVALFIKSFADPAFWMGIGKTAADFGQITWGAFFWNLLPVTLGNIIGGASMVGAVYWFIYLRPRQ